MEPEKLFGQEATHFRLRFVLGPNTTVDGRLVLELADIFLDRLLFPGSPPVSIWTKVPGMAARLSIVEFSGRRWDTARKKIADNKCEVLRLEARTADFPNQTIALSVQANPAQGHTLLRSGTIDIICSVPYLRHLSASPDKLVALFDFGASAWNGARAVYGFGNLAIIPRRPGLSFAEGGPPSLELTAPPAARAHPIPIAQVGNDIDGNLDGLIAAGRGIKGAYWANYLGATHVGMAGGERALTDRLAGLRITPLAEGALLIVATDSPLPADSEENRARFSRLESALRPAFLSRAETPDNKRALLGYFYRENQ